MSETKVLTLEDIENQPEVNKDLGYFMRPENRHDNIAIDMADATRRFPVSAETLSSWSQRAEDPFWTRQGKGFMAGLRRTWDSFGDMGANFENLDYRYVFPDSDEDESRLLMEIGLRNQMAKKYAREYHEYTEGTDDSIMANISGGLASALAYGGATLAAGAIGGPAAATATLVGLSGAQLGLEKAEEAAEKHAQKTGDYRLRDYDKTKDLIALGYGAVGGWIEGRLGGAEKLIAGVLGKSSKATLRRAALGFAEEGTEEFLQELTGGIAGMMGGFEDRDWLKIFQDSLISGVYGAAVGGLVGGGMYYYHRGRLAQQFNDAGFSKEESRILADNIIDNTKSKILKEVSTVTSLENHFGSAYNDLIGKIESALDAAGWDKTQIDPKTKLPRDKHEYAKAAATDIAYQVLRQAKINKVPVSDILDLADIVAIKNVLYLKPKNLGTIENIEALIKQKKAEKNALIKSAQTMAGDSNRKSLLNTQIAVLQNLLDLKKSQLKAKQDARPQELKDRSELAKADAKVLEKSDNVVDFAQNISKPDQQVTPVEAKKRHDDATLMWLLDGDKNAFESLIEIGNTGNKVLSGILNSIENIYQFQKENPDIDLRADIQGALKRLPDALSGNFAEYVSLPSNFNENALLYAFAFGSADDINTFLNKYMDKIKTNKENGKFQAGTFRRCDAYAQCLKMFKDAFDGSVAKDVNMRGVMLSMPKRIRKRPEYTQKNAQTIKQLFNRIINLDFARNEGILQAFGFDESNPATRIHFDTKGGAKDWQEIVEILNREDIMEGYADSYEQQDKLVDYAKNLLLNTPNVKLYELRNRDSDIKAIEKDAKIAEQGQEAQMDSLLKESKLKLTDDDLKKMSYKQKSDMLAELYPDTTEYVNPDLTLEELEALDDSFWQEEELYDLADDNARLDEIYPEYKGETIIVDGKERTVYNSKGERINKSAEALTNFWKWFGDSKVVDEQGRPLVVYHGTNAEFSEFDARFIKSSTGRADLGLGYYFSSEKTGSGDQSADWYGNIIMPVYLKSENPFIVPENEKELGKKLLSLDPNIETKFGEKISDRLKENKQILMRDISPSKILNLLLENKYDGIISVSEYVVHYSTQIKSVDNRGTYSSDTGNIYLQGSKKQGMYDPELQVIIIGKDFNTGTLPHEFAHFWLDDIFRRATTYNDWTPEFIEQANNLFAILGVEENQKQLTREQHEKFARMVENVVFGLQPAPAGAELPTLAYLNWIPEKYKSIADIRYKDEDGTYHYPLLDKDAADFFNAWYSNTNLPDIGTSPLEIQNENFTDRNGDVVPSTPEIMKLRDNTQEQAVKDQAEVDKEIHDSGVENTPTDTRAEMTGYNTQASREATTPEPVVQPQPKKKSILRIGRGTNTRAEMIEEAQKYIDKNKEHAEEIAFGDPELVENDSGIERGILIRQVMNNYKKGSQEYATLYDNLARTMSLAGKTGGLNNDMQVRFYLEGYSRLNKAMEAKAAAKYAGSNRGAITKFNQDIQAFIASKADAILATEPGSKERNDLIDAMIREAEIKFAGGTGDARMLFQENNFGQKARRQNKADFIKWADKEIKKMLKANPESDPTIISELITKSEKAQVAKTQIDSKNINESVAAAQVLREWQEYTDSLDDTVLDSQISKLNRWFRKIVGNWQPFAMLTNINTHTTNMVSNTVNLATVQASLAAQYGKAQVDSALIKREHDRIWAIYNTTQIDISQMLNPATPSLLHGEKIDVNAKNKLRVLDTRMWLGKEDLMFRSRVYLSTLAHIATKNAKASGKSANELFEQYCNLNQEAGSEAEQARQQAVLMGNIATFTQNGKFSGMLQKVRTEINKFTDPTGRAGFGTMLAPFLKTPANIVELGVRATFAPITDVAALLKKSWGMQDTLNTVYFLLAIVLSAAVDDYEKEYESGKKYDPTKPYDSVNFGGNAWFKLDLFGALETPLRFLSALKTNKGLGISGVVNATPLVGDISESISGVERASKSSEKLLSFGINYAYNQVNKSVPAIIKQTANLANTTDLDLEQVDIGIKTGLGRKIGRQYGLDAQERTDIELYNDVLGTFFNRLKLTE